VRCLARRPDFLASRVGPRTEVVQGDVLREETLAPALAGIDSAYYLIHSMGGSEGFEERDREGARNFARAARAAGVRRIVYLGGLGDERDDLSPHLRSRHEVGRVLRSSGVPVIELRASIVIGSGSLSFEMLRSLVERLPVMVTPRWVDVRSQPIAIGDLLDYLEAALDLECDDSRTYEIGGTDQVSYGDLMREYARQRGLRRAMLPVPVLTPRLSSLWLGLVTPLYARVGRVLIESICHETVVRDERARRDFACKPMGVSEAIAQALVNEDREFAQTRWSDAISAGGTDPGGLSSYGGVRAAASSTWRRPRPSPPSAASAERRAGTPTTGCGACAASSTCCSGAWGCGAAGRIPRRCTSGTRSTGGGSRPSSPTACCGCAPRCACRDGPGSSSRWSPKAAAAPCDRPPCSTPAGCSG
jgi:uncharacterized protein YbjT (DUF2867 family)